MDQQGIVRPGTPAWVSGRREQAGGARFVKSLTAATAGLMTNPRIGERLQEFEPGEVRRIIVGHYEMRYEIVESTIYVLRLWHTREAR